jgi:hypothetical protein
MTGLVRLCQEAASREKILFCIELSIAARRFLPSPPAVCHPDRTPVREVSHVPMQDAGKDCHELQIRASKQFLELIKAPEDSSLRSE